MYECLKANKRNKICKKEPGLNLLYDANEVNSMNVKSKVKWMGLECL